MLPTNTAQLITRPHCFSELRSRIYRYVVFIYFLTAVADAGLKGEDLTKDFFREEYMLNHTIGLCLKDKDCIGALIANGKLLVRVSAHDTGVSTTSCYLSTFPVFMKHPLGDN